MRPKPKPPEISCQWCFERVNVKDLPGSYGCYVLGLFLEDLRATKIGLVASRALIHD
jgi:hypothetical protein